MNKIYSSTILLLTCLLLSISSFGQIVAENDTMTQAVGATGNPNDGNVLNNNGNGADTLNGNPVTISQVNITVVTPATQISTGSSVPILNTTTGVASVPLATPSGTYTIVYQICEIANPTNCSVANVTFNVVNAVIQTNNDIGTPINGAIGGQAIANVLANDSLNGAPSILSMVNLTMVSSTTSGVTLNSATGSVFVSPGVPAGNYTITYSICEKLNPTNCAFAAAIVSVIASPITAVNDIGTPINGSLGGQAIANIFLNDTLNGVAPTLLNVNLMQGLTSPPGVTLNTATGSVNVSSGVPAGNYTITYSICEKLNPTNCATAYAIITITPAPIQATNDDFSGTSIVGSSGGTTASVLNNDSFNTIAVNPSSINLTSISFPTGFTLNPDGTIAIATGVAAGAYSLTYQICERLNPNNCSSATVAILVSNSLLPPTGNTSQSLTIGSTLADLVVYGQNILWYAHNYAGKIQHYADTPLPSTTVLVNGATYFASQTVGGIESTSRLPITVSLIAMSTSNFAFSNFNYYPNPVKNSVTISNASIIDEIEITSILGQRMITKKVNDLQTEVNLSELSNGVYFVKVKSDTQEKTVKIIKE